MAANLFQTKTDELMDPKEFKTVVKSFAFLPFNTNYEFIERITSKQLSFIQLLANRANNLRYDNFIKNCLDMDNWYDVTKNLHKIEIVKRFEIDTKRKRPISLVKTYLCFIEKTYEFYKHNKISSD